MTRFKAMKGLEKLVLASDVKEVVIGIRNGLRLSRADVFSTSWFNRFTLEAAMTLAFIGLPKKLWKDAVELVKQKYGEDSMAYDFLSVEYRTFDEEPEYEKDDIEMLNALKDNDESRIVSLCDSHQILSKDFSDEYISHIASLTPETRKLFLANGLYTRQQVLLLKKLLEAENNEKVASKVIMRISQEKRSELIDDIMLELTKEGDPAVALIDLDKETMKEFKEAKASCESFGHADPPAIDVTMFRGKQLKEAMEKNGWGQYDLYSNSIHVGLPKWRDIAMENITKLLKTLEIPYEYDEEDNTIHFRLSCEYVFDYSVSLGNESFSVNSKCSMNCPKKSYANIMEYLNQVNMYLRFGMLYLDTDYGQVSFKFTQFYSKSITYPVILCYNLISLAMRVYEQYHTGLEHVIKGKLSPYDACDAAFCSKESNFCNWYDDTQSPCIIFIYPKE